jgi:hypothetical protein
MPYTTNLCPNPSIEVNLTGYTALNNAALGIDSTTAVAGSQALVVQTPGVVPGEGFTGPVATMPAGVCSMSIYLSGQSNSVFAEVGTSVIVAAVTAGGAILSQVIIPLPPVFTPVVLNNLAFAAPGPLQVMVITPISQNLLFWVDAVQYEPESPAQPYIDGDQLGCIWSGTPGLSSSTQPNEFYIDTTLTSRADGYVNVIAPGAIELFAGTNVLETDVTMFLGEPTQLTPVSAFDDFGVYQLTDVDPALSYPSWNNQGLLSGYLDYNRSYAMFVPPLDYVVSGGQYLWRRAAFASFGWQFANVPAGQAQNLTNAQVEFAMINGTNPVVPRAFEPPRQLYVNVQPDRLNLCPNPSFEVSLADWRLTGASASITQDGSQSVPDVGTFGNVLYGAGNFSLNCTINSGTQQSVSIDIPQLIIGRMYTASAYIQTTEGFDNIYMSISNGSVNLSQTGGDPPYGGDLVFPGYSEEFYGGVGDFIALPPLGWTRLSCSFQANFDVHTLSITASVDGAASYPCTFWVDAVLVEPGEVAEPYFDGSFGTDALWEFGGTPGLTRSYYYTQFAQKQHIVNSVLSKNIPLGISYAPWTYAGGAVATGTGSGSSSGSGSGGGGGGGGGNTIILYNTPGTFLWTCPAGIFLVYAECWGAGSGGSGGAQQGQGGAGGAYSAEPALVVTPGHTYTIVIGGGGVGSKNLGTAGGQSTVTGDAVTVLAHGGQAPTHDNIATGGSVSGNAVSFAGGNGAITFSGENGAGGGSSAGPSSAGKAGSAGNVNNHVGGSAVSAGGPGGNGGAYPSQNGFAPASGPGGGGGGGAYFNGIGANGVAGQVRLTYA